MENGAIPDFEMYCGDCSVVTQLEAALVSLFSLINNHINLAFSFHIRLSA